MTLENGLLLLPSGNHRIVCPTCGGGSTKEKCMSVEVAGKVIKYCCFRAGCGVGGTLFTEGTVGHVILPMKERAKDYHMQGYVRHPVYDNDGGTRGWVHRATKKGRVPKSINDIDDDWCMLHIPSRIKGESVLLVEDMASAEAMDKFYPTVALLGVQLTADKIKYLTRQGVKCGIIALDDDATLTALRILRDNAFVGGILKLNHDLKDTPVHKLMSMATELEARYD